MNMRYYIFQNNLISPFWDLSQTKWEISQAGATPLPRLVLLVAVVAFDGRLPYRRKQHSLALLLGTKVLSLARVCAERRLFLHL